MVDDYDDACEAELTFKQVKKEIEQHNLSMDDFVKDSGSLGFYKGETVLNWLGY